MTKALVALNHATYGGVYYSANVDFTDLTVQPTWTKYATTGLANLLIKRMQNDYYLPYTHIYVQLDDGTVYRWNGTSWTEIMTKAAALAAIGWADANIYVGEISVDYATAGTIYYPIAKVATGSRLLKSVDYGATWSIIVVINSATYNGVTYVQAYGQYLIVCRGGPYRRMAFSETGGTSWTTNLIWSTSSGGAQVRQDIHHPTRAYYRQSASDADLIMVTKASTTEIQSGYGLAGITLHEHRHWIHPYTADYQRILRNSGTDVYIYSTVDAWTNFVDSTPTALSTGQAVTWGALHAAYENTNFAMFGMDQASPGVVNYHLVHGFTGDNPTAIYGICGTNYVSSPYTDAIPCVNDGYIASQGIYVGEGPASRGVYLFSVEMAAYDTDHKPKLGDRSSWRDMDADLNELDDPASWTHAEDIYEDTPQRHNAWPVASGNIQVSDGAEWVETEPIAFIVAGAMPKIVVYEGDVVTHEGEVVWET